MSNFKKIFASILPGIFLIGYNIGTGSVTAMAKAGAYFGLELLWAVLGSCIVTYYLIVIFSRYTMVTGDTIIQGIKKHIHPSVAIILITALSIIILSALMGLIGILADVLEVWTKTIMTDGISSLTWAISIATVIYILLWIGDYAFFEKVLAVLVAIMGTAFIATMFIKFPSIKELAAGFVPSLPENAIGSDNSPLIIISAMVGTTVSVFAFIIRSQTVKEVGWTMKDDKIQKIDAVVSASMMFIISAAVLITAASTLHVQGVTLNNVAEMVPLLEPVAGKAALSVFVIGIVAAGLASHIPNLIVIPWLIIDYKNEERNTKTKRYRIIMLILSIISVFGVVLGFEPVFVLMLSQACIAIVLPITIACIFYLTSKKKLMNNYTNSSFDFVAMFVILLFSIYVSGLGIKGLMIDLATIVK